MNEDEPYLIFVECRGTWHLASRGKSLDEARRWCCNEIYSRYPDWTTVYLAYPHGVGKPAGFILWTEDGNVGALEKARG